jgi:ABC-type amino acid transport substrate-binding protein
MAAFNAQLKAMKRDGTLDAMVKRLASKEAKVAGSAR